MEKELSLQEIHTETLQILEKIISVCQECDAEYFLIYGSLLGAIRHKGFIPWDDDMDIAMLRPSFDTFCQYCHEHEEELYPYKLIDRTNTSDYPYNIPRFCDLRYRMETEEVPDAGMGMFIDIYPLDGLGTEPEKDKKNIQVKKKLYLSAADYIERGRFHKSKKGFFYSVIRYIVYIWSKMHDVDYFYEKMDELGKKYPLETSTYVDCLVWDTTFYLVLKEDCETLIDAEFEGMTVKIPSGYDAMLREYYGDYMKLPPESKRVPSHGYKLYRK